MLSLSLWNSHPPARGALWRQGSAQKRSRLRKLYLSLFPNPHPRSNTLKDESPARALAILAQLERGDLRLSYPSLTAFPRVRSSGPKLTFPVYVQRGKGQVLPLTSWGNSTRQRNRQSPARRARTAPTRRLTAL